MCLGLFGSGEILEGRCSMPLGPLATSALNISTRALMRSSFRNTSKDGLMTDVLSSPS